MTVFVLHINSVFAQADILRPNTSDDGSMTGLSVPAIWGKGREMADFKTFNKFETYFYMEIPHFEYGSFIEEEICLSRWYQIYFNIYPQMFLQEIAVLFIFYLFCVLLDLIDFGSEKSFTPHAIFHICLLYQMSYRWCSKMRFSGVESLNGCHLNCEDKDK